MPLQPQVAVVLMHRIADARRSWEVVLEDFCHESAMQVAENAEAANLVVAMLAMPPMIVAVAQDELRFARLQLMFLIQATEVVGDAVQLLIVDAAQRPAIVVAAKVADEQD